MRHAQSGAKLRGDFGKGKPLMKQLRPADVGRQIAVAQVKPSISSIPPQHFQSGESVAGNPPTAALASPIAGGRDRGGKPGQSVHHSIQIGRYAQAVKLVVIAGVYRHHQVVRRQAVGQADDQLGAADAAGQSQDAHRAFNAERTDAAGARICLSPRASARSGRD